MGEYEKTLAAKKPTDRPLIDLGTEGPSVDDCGHALITALIVAVAWALTAWVPLIGPNTGERITPAT